MAPASSSEPESSDSGSDIELELPSKRRRGDPRPASQASRQEVAYEALAAHGFQGGPSLAERAAELRDEERKQKADKAEVDAKAAAAAAAKQKQAEEEAAAEKPVIVTQCERRGAVRKAQAEALMAHKQAAGAALDLSMYKGVGALEKAAEQEARQKPDHGSFNS